MEKIKVNGKIYQAVDIDFNFVCTLEEAGISLQDFGKKAISAVRCYVAECMGAPLEIAGKEIEKHMIGGGNLDDIMDVMSKKIDDSDFFRSFKDKTEEESESPKTNKKKDQEVSE